MAALQRELEPLCCLNCGVRWAPMPRQGMCNACGIYLTNNKRHRPLALAHKLQRAEPWKFTPSTPPGHVLKKKDNGKTVAVPLEDLEGGAPADNPNGLPITRWLHCQTPSLPCHPHCHRRCSGNLNAHWQAVMSRLQSCASPDPAHAVPQIRARICLSGASMVVRPGRSISAWP